MSILIKGMEMPKDGHWGTVSIPFYIHGDGSVSDSKGHILGSAVYIPPHGRLGDLDKMKESIRKQTAFLRILGGEFAEIAETLEKGFLREIDNAPTILPAEEGE